MVTESYFSLLSDIGSMSPQMVMVWVNADEANLYEIILFLFSFYG